ncbi:galectin 17 [Nothobranchius furzeri]|uniref:LOC107394436-like protein n=1 Tax=Nothobranchius furzeri TaxID=105023 RepID=A0A1A8VAD7_NOTFU|nr:putative LOC107394436-like protein [Nothobranchius furzeri]
MTTRLWFFIYLQCFLTGSLVDSSTLPAGARPQYIFAMVGNEAKLPCSWKSHQDAATPSPCHIQWVSPPHTVFEQDGEDKWQAEEFEGRLEVPQEKLGLGDCSLIIKDVQIVDTGKYESFMIVEGARSKMTRVFIQSVKLRVNDHKTEHSHRPGEDFVLTLYTPRSSTVVFQGRNSSEWLDLWTRGGKSIERMEKDPHHEQLTLKNVKISDEGTYKVLDDNGLSVSTMQLSIEENPPMFRARLNLQNAPSDAADRSSCSALLIFSILATSFQIFHHH